MFSFHRLRYQLMLLTILLAVVPLVATSYFMIQKASQGLLREKEWWLYGLARQLDQAMPGSFNDILAAEGLTGANRETKIRALNRALRDVTDRVAAAYPGVGVGYYSRDLDAIITYGPSSQYQDKVGLSIGKDHRGRQVMADGRPQVQIGNLVRGDIVNAMIPIRRHGRVIGYIWANVFTSAVHDQVVNMLRPFYAVLLLALLMALAGSALLSNRVACRVEAIKDGLERLKHGPGLRLRPLPGEMGEIAAAINDMVDRREELEEQVRRVERLAAVGELAAGMAHEIRNPLTAISGFAQYLARVLPPGGELHQHADIITTEVLRVDRIIQQMLDFARPRENFLLAADINQLVDEVLLLIKGQAEKRQVAVEFAPAAGLPAVPVDSQQIKQVFLNLALNAVQVMSGGGRLAVETAMADGRVAVSWWNGRWK
ncbi:histidine kinase dimerization/phospho-acceptor domain-containing protein [Desulfotomaculum copahuensis]|nr:histidine kinase dimerization/phospho-acceptor domain-containing protein [Desulfotomaculum copahuensis]